ncbi:MAG TPA: tocopherol cyclase family protein [bacterium]
MLNYIKSLWRLGLYHGSGKKGNFFEGWFFKIVDRAKEHIFAFIPGISLGEDPHAFIQILDGKTHQSSYIRFPVEDFKASTKKMEIQIGDNIFSGEAIELNIKTDNRQIKGKLDFGESKPWPVKIASPGVMGWYAFVPLMECFHGVISFDHAINGTLSINKSNIQFDGGRGYIEKDWGRSFPSAYVWIQSNHFEQPGVSLMASVAKIPWLRKSFRGFIIGLFIDNKLYRFTTYNGAQLNYLRLNEFQVQLQVSDKKYILNIEARRAEGGLLHAPYNKQMLTRISETLSSQVKIELFHRKKISNQLIFSGEGNPAGLDVNGMLKDIIDK